MNVSNRNGAANLTPQARSRGGSNSPGNFKNDPTRASEAGRKGGRASRGGGRKKQGSVSRTWEDMLE